MDFVQVWKWSGQVNSPDTTTVDSRKVAQRLPKVRESCFHVGV